MGSQVQSSVDVVYRQPLTSASSKCLERGKEGPRHPGDSPGLRAFKDSELRGYILGGRECLQGTDENGLKPGLNHPCRRKWELELIKPIIQ